MSISKKAVAIAVGSLFALSIPTSAFALSASCDGAYGTTVDSGHQVMVKDTASDSHSAQANYHVSGTTTPWRSIEATNGDQDVAYSAKYQGIIDKLQVCAVNSNPFDTDPCSQVQP